MEGGKLKSEAEKPDIRRVFCVFFQFSEKPGVNCAFDDFQVSGEQKRKAGLNRPKRPASAFFVFMYVSWIFTYKIDLSIYTIWCV